MHAVIACKQQRVQPCILLCTSVHFKSEIMCLDTKLYITPLCLALMRSTMDAGIFMHKQQVLQYLDLHLAQLETMNIMLRPASCSAEDNEYNTGVMQTCCITCHACHAGDCSKVPSQGLHVTTPQLWRLTRPSLLALAFQIPFRGVALVACGVSVSHLYASFVHEYSSPS